ncbi:transposase [Thermodesulforhabdus norvegica]|uniref:Mutator family transposase n=1 Tax=Thermodesulforhabdus norvegica TaxID=39841 RepID=A0A1I4VW06_9BACT|nr:transposase [Thermodesulforhabdus norvegica]SFN05375.1 Transposase, Mutator family [Thermodesulforhabdus norvegica]
MLGFTFLSHLSHLTSHISHLSHFKSRGLKRVDLFIADGLRGLEEAVFRKFPGSRFQLCVLHAVKGSLKKVRKKDREAVAESLKAIYRASNREKARQALIELKEKWGKMYPEVVKRWEESLIISPPLWTILRKSEDSYAPPINWKGL